MMRKNLFYHLFAGRKFIFVGRSRTSPLIPSSRFLQTFSSLAKGESNISTIHTNSPLQTPSAEVASRNLNISSADIVRMTKIAPMLQRPETFEKAEQVVAMLQSQGCKIPQIAKVMETNPSLLTKSLEKVVKPKLQFLKFWGIEGATLARILTFRAGIMSASLENVLLPTMMFLKNVFQSQDFLLEAVAKNPYLLTHYDVEKIMKPSVAYWGREHGLCGIDLAMFLLRRPGLLSCTSLGPAKIELIQKIGVKKGGRTYKHILLIVASSRLQTLEDKMENFQRCGLTAGETLMLFRVSPYVFTLDFCQVRKIMGFMVNDMGLPAKSVLDHPHLLQLSLEEVLKPRFLVWQRMESMKGAGRPKVMHNYSALMMICTTLMMSEKDFLKKIVNSHRDSAVLSAIYREAICNASRHTEISRKT